MSHAILTFLLLVKVYSCVDASEARRWFLLDYSFRPHSWLQSLRDHEPLKQITSPQHNYAGHTNSELLLELDVSSSCIGDDGVLLLTQALHHHLPQHPQLQGELNSSTNIGLTLRSSMNRLTPWGVSLLIQNLLIHNNQTSHSNQNRLESFTDDKDTLHNVMFHIQELDLSFNDFSGYYGPASHQGHQRGKTQKGYHAFLKSIRFLIEDEMGTGTCPVVLRLETCGLGPQFCRSIAKSIINGASFYLQRNQSSNSSTYIRQHLQLYLSGNDAIGDSGVAALAAALKTAARASYSQPIIHTLDLSSCSVGDAGAEALANAIEGNPGCIRALDLSNNKITDEGAASLGRALQHSMESSTSSTSALEYLNLSNNKNIGDKGLTELTSAMGYEALRRLSLRSCSVRSEGASAVGKMFSSLAKKNCGGLHVSSSIIPIEVDLSGNSFGSLQEKESSGYSASLLKSKASATTASYLNFIGKKIKSGLKDAGLDVQSLLPSDAQSDDDEDEVEVSSNPTEDDDKSIESFSFDRTSKYSISPCGARSFSDAILDCQEDNQSSTPDNHRSSERYRFHLGMRLCALDSVAYEALASSISCLKNRYKIDLFIDVELNKNVDPDQLVALGDMRSHLDLIRLGEMSDKYLEARETIRRARERAEQVAEAAAARHRAEDAISGMMGDDENGEDMKAYNDWDRNSYPFEENDDSYNDYSQDD